MRDREALGIGGIGAIVVNILHPHPPERTDELLTLVAFDGIWMTLLGAMMLRRSWPRTAEAE